MVTAGHLSAAGDYRTPVGVVQAHPAAPGEVVLGNVSDATWVAEPTGEEPKTVAPGRRIRVRPMTLSFGAASGSIRTPQRPG